MYLNKLDGYLSLDIEQLKGGAGVTIGQEGVPYDVLNFEPSGITVEKIAISLSRSARYLGNARILCSVARHSVRGAEAFLLMGKVAEAKMFLFHDAGEAIYGDMSRPFKKIIEEKAPDLKELMTDIDKQICDKFEVQWPWVPEIKVMDDNLAIDELTNEIWLANVTEITGQTRYDYDSFINCYRKILAYEAIKEMESDEHTSVDSTRRTLLDKVENKYNEINR
jgi:5'-deoxynucleotidase YfbR-like HD superfamily hydrolase